MCDNSPSIHLTMQCLRKQVLLVYFVYIYQLDIRSFVTSNHVILLSSCDRIARHYLNKLLEL